MDFNPTNQNNSYPKIHTKWLWSESEDINLAKVVSTHGPQNWNFVASFVPGRSAKQCRERWHNHLNPALKKSEWSPEEDSLIIQQTKTIGFKWACIAKLLPGRSDNSIKNRYNRFLKKIIEGAEQINSSSETDSDDSSPKRQSPISSPVSNMNTIPICPPAVTTRQKRKYQETGFSETKLVVDVSPKRKTQTLLGPFDLLGNLMTSVTNRFPEQQQQQQTQSQQIQQIQIQQIQPTRCHASGLFGYDVSSHHDNTFLYDFGPLPSCGELISSLKDEIPQSPFLFCVTSNLGISK